VFAKAEFVSIYLSSRRHNTSWQAVRKRGIGRQG
jgi:hypothetical protein